MKIAFVGDVSLGDYYPSFGHGPGSYGKNSQYFTEVAPLFQKADLVVGNLEAPISESSCHPDGPESTVLRAHPSVVHQLMQAGFNVMQVANNHSVQHGDAAFQRTVDILEEQGIKTVGKRDESLLVVNTGGKSIGFMAASDVPDNTFSDQTVYERLDNDFIERVKNNVTLVDHLIVMLHWGLECSTTPLPYQKELARELRLAGVRAVIGTHPHLFYEIETHKNSVIAYSLGNFVFDLCWDKRLQQTGILIIEIQENTTSSTVYPIKMTHYGSRPVPSGEASASTSGTITLYDNGTSMSWQMLKKSIYLITHLPIGNTLLKLNFILSKLRRKAGI